MKILCFFAVLLAFNLSSAQELSFSPITKKDVPPGAIEYLNLKKEKVKKAKWYFAQPGVYIADFNKKKQNKLRYYFTSDGRYLYLRTPLKPEELTPELNEMLGDRMKHSSARLFQFQSGETKFVAIEIPTSENAFVTKYFSLNGEPMEVHIK